MYITIPVYLLLIILCFYILGSTADGYLSPALEKLASTLGFSESLAGVTLLALGNGAPDVISSLSAASSSSGGMFLAVGSLVGAGLFVSGVVSAVVILSSPKPIHVLGKAFLRDIIFYIISLSVLVIASFVGELSVYFGIIFFAIYIIFVVLVVVMDKIDDRNKAKRIEMRKNLQAKRETVGRVTDEEQEILDDADLDDDAYYFKDENDHLVDIQIEHNDPAINDDEKFSQVLDSADDDVMVEDYVDDEEDVENYKIQDNNSVIEKSLTLEPSVPKVQNLKTTIDEVDPVLDKQSSLRTLSDKIDKTRIEQNKDLSSFLMEDHYEEEQVTRQTDKVNIIQKSKTRIRASKTKHKIVWSMLKMKKFLKKGVEGEETFAEMNIFNKIIYIFIDAPIDFLRRVTIPPSDNETWDRRLATAVPIFSIFFIFSVTGIIDFRSVPPLAFWIAEGIAVILAIIIWFTTPLNKGPRRGMIVFAIFAFILSIVWIWFIANILIDLLGVLGLILGFKPSFLGITMLAWGNSVGDMMANSAVAKKGFARMALTGCFAGPLFNLLIGLGMSLVIKRINGQPPEVFEIKDREAILPMMAIGGLIFQLLMVSLISILSKFHLKKIQGIIQTIYFIAALVVITVAAFTFAK